MIIGQIPSKESWSIVRLPTPCAPPTVPQSRRWPRGALALALLLGMPAHASERSPAETALPGWARMETRLSLTPEMLESRWTSLVRAPNSAPDYSLATAVANATWDPIRHAPNLIDITPTRLAAGEPQVYVRPQFALGMSSDSLRSWLQFAGVNASTCTAPLMKMHSSFAGSSSHAKVSLSARCSIH